MGEAKAVWSECSDAGVPGPWLALSDEGGGGGCRGAGDESKLNGFPVFVEDGLPVPEDDVETELLLVDEAEVSESARTDVLGHRDLDGGDCENISGSGLISDSSAPARSSFQKDAEKLRVCRPFIRQGVA